MNKKSDTKKISVKSLSHTFQEAFDLREGWWFTFKELTLRPGSSLKRYLSGERKLVNPIKYLLLAISLSLLASFLTDKFGPSETMLSRTDLEEQVLNYLVAICFILASAIVLFLFNRKKEYNFLEYLVVSVYWYAHITIVVIIIIDFGGLFFYFLSGHIGFIYSGIKVLVGLILVFSYLFWGTKSLLTNSFLKTSLTMLIVFIAFLVTSIAQVAIMNSIFQNPDTKIGIIPAIPEEKDIYNESLFSASETPLQVDSVLVNGPAWLAGIMKGDTILSVNGEKTSRINFKSQITKFESGETILLSIQRNGLKHDVPVTLTNNDSLNIKSQTLIPK
ncbi:DUF3667 domain-containing protein [Muriicola sp. SD30]|uniref:DUF3667 domain-containing protein n=1 Tax=Muriicola sp. SD30 TaxID=3240936 RepID=UPI0035101A5B